MDDDDEPQGMSGALSSSRSGGGNKKKDEGCSEWRRKEKKSKKERKKESKKKGKVDVTFGGMGSVGAAISASAYYKDVGKKGLKKRKTDQLSLSTSGFDMPLTKEEKKRRKERQVRALFETANDVVYIWCVPQLTSCILCSRSFPKHTDAVSGWCYCRTG